MQALAENIIMTIQDRMNDAFNNYISVSEILASDLLEMAENEREDESWKRNYIRVVASFIEGNSYCLKKMCAIGLECDDLPHITSKEEKALKSVMGFTAIESIKLVLRTTYKMFDLGEQPDFRGSEWENAVLMFNKRHSIMHPKSSADMEIAVEEWGKIQAGANWLIKHHFNVTAIIYKKYVKKNS